VSTIAMRRIARVSTSMSVPEIELSASASCDRSGE